MNGIPHLQLDQYPPLEIYRRLIDLSLGLPAVGEQESRLASPKTLALYLPHHAAGGERDAYIDDHEFCHIHPMPSGCVHLTLPQPLRGNVLDRGWGELHPAAAAGFLTSTLVLIYAPRDQAELDIVFGLVTSAYRFARGLSCLA